MKTIYLDNNATTRVDEAVLAEMLPYLGEYYGNASSVHAFGGNMRHKIDKARGQVAELIGCDAGEIIFTGCGTESDNTAIRGILEGLREKRHVITTRVEHPAVRGTCRLLQKQGCRLTELAVDGNGRLDIAQLEESLTDETALVTIMYANNETGVVFPIPEIAEIVKGRDCLLHTDAVQAVGKVPINVGKLPVDLLSMSGHKLHAPKGVGVLYVRRGTRLTPLLTGGHQEFSRRAGTENVAGIVAIGKACELARQNMQSDIAEMTRLRDRLESGLLANCPNARVNGDTKSRLVNTTNISFEYIEGEAILLMLDHLGICASSGSACTSGSLEPSHVLRAMGVPFTAVHGSIRFSLSRYTTQDEVDYVVRELPAVIKRLREISLFSAANAPGDEAPVELPPQLRL